MSKRNNGINVPENLQASIIVPGDDEELNFYHKVQLKEYRVSTDPSNCWFLTHKNEIMCVINIIRHKERIYLCCIQAKNNVNFFDIPIQSKHFNIFSTVRASHFKDSETKLILLDDIKCKLVRLPYQDNDVFIPLLHTHMYEN